MAAEFVTVFKTSQIASGAVMSADVRGVRIAVANVGGTYYAFDDTCTHEQCSLAEQGELADATITCTCHNSEFDVRSGKNSRLRALIPLKRSARASMGTRCRSRSDGQGVCDCRRKPFRSDRRRDPSRGGGGRRRHHDWRRTRTACTNARRCPRPTCAVMSRWRRGGRPARCRSRARCARDPAAHR